MKRAAITATLIAALAACSPDPAPATNSAEQITPPAAAIERFRRFQIGSLNAVALLDGSLSVPNDGHSFTIGQAKGVGALLANAGLPGNEITLSIEPLYVDAGSRKLLFDTGFGPSLPTSGQLMASMRAAGIDPASITDIFISHIHGDHVVGLVKAGGVLAFPNATIHLSARDWADLRSFQPAAAARHGIPDIRDFLIAVTPKVVTFEPGAVIVPDVVSAVDIRGHTPGHSGFRIASGDQSLFYVGDALHHFIISVERPRWHNAFDEDKGVAAQSRQALVANAARTGERLYVTHFPFPGIGRIEQRGENSVWVAE
jgi:glyoxylase-like metal-dependent hydrolase (beta-lactamase superfamily II)